MVISLYCEILTTTVIKKSLKKKKKSEKLLNFNHFYCRNEDNKIRNLNIKSCGNLFHLRRTKRVRFEEINLQTLNLYNIHKKERIRKL